MNECLDLNIQIVPRFHSDGRLQVQAMLNGRKLWEYKQVFKLIELFYVSLKPVTDTYQKLSLIRKIRKQTEELLAILTVQEAALAGTVADTVEDDPF